MKKGITSALTALLCLGMLAGCAAQGNVPESIPTSPPASVQAPASTTANVSAAYEKLVAYKTESYTNETITEFNRSLLPENGSLSELLDAHAEVMESISPDDENYEFITLTLAASLDELYCEQMNDEIGFSGYLKKQARPVEALEGEEGLSEEQVYEFVFNALYTVGYTVTNPDTLTVADRDTALQTFRIELQGYIDGLTEAELMNGNIREMLSDKAAELANGLSSDMMTLSCEISGIEIHNAGTERQG